MDNSGYLFSPGIQPRTRNDQPGQSPLNGSGQSALQILSLALPGVLGGHAVAPDVLLRPRLGGIRPDLAVRSQVTGTPSTAPAPAAISNPASSIASPGGSAVGRINAIGAGLPSAAPHQFASPAAENPFTPSTNFVQPLSPVPSSPVQPSNASAFANLLQSIFGGAGGGGVGGFGREGDLGGSFGGVGGSFSGGGNGGNFSGGAMPNFIVRNDFNRGYGPGEGFSGGQTLTNYGG